MDMFEQQPGETTREIEVPETFSLRQTCAPVWWVRHRSPRHAWIDDRLIEVESVGDVPLMRVVSQPEAGRLRVTSVPTEEPDRAWAARVLGVDSVVPDFGDPVIAALAAQFPGLRPHSDGSIFDGILTAIIGQSVSLASAAAAQYKLAAAFNPEVERFGRKFLPLPSASQLADASVELIRSCGVTWKRAEAIRLIAQEQELGNLPDEVDAKSDQAAVIKALLTLPMVGRWTAESVLLWGVGAIDAHPTNDVALLNATRRAYERPDLTFRGLDDLSEQWRPGRSMAARLLWTDFLGLPPEVDVVEGV